MTNTNAPSPELLSPAGNMEKLKYALAFGADAVYAGIPRYSLRTRENDFNTGNLPEAIAYTHALGRKIYMTMNIYAHNAKVEGFRKMLDQVAEWQPDGLIMSDPGLIKMVLQNYPELPVHLSTQANVTNWTAVEFWRDLGVQRVILSRELSLKEIATMHEMVPDVELESFVHGAICIAYSGRCLISNYLTHRDANQGTCTNSCRWPYLIKKEKPSLVEWEEQQHAHTERIYPDSTALQLEDPTRPGNEFPVSEDEQGTYLFNAKDLCAVELLTELRDAGVISFKIEGRTKSSYYTALATRAYRQAIDDMNSGKPFSENNLRDLFSLSNRQYTTGFYRRNPRHLGENRLESRSIERSHRAVGIDPQYDSDRGLVSFEVRNRLERGTAVDVITPDRIIPAVIQELYNDKEMPVDVVHGGAGRCWFPLEVDPGAFALVRRELYPAEQKDSLEG